MHSISVEPAKRRRRANEKAKQVKLNKKLLDECGFAMLSEKDHWWVFNAGPAAISFSVEVAEFLSVADVVEASYKQGRHHVQTDMKRALGIT